MEMEVASPLPAVDFNFDSACVSPYSSCPSSPQRFGNFFFSAPTSPTRASSFYREFNSFSRAGSRRSLSTIPFNWEEKPGIPKAKDNTGGDDENDFEFDFSGQFDRTSLSADELFDGGKIKPLKPPPGLQVSDNGLNGSPKSPRSPTGRKFFREALSPRSKMKDFDPFEAAIEQTRRERNPQDDRNEQRQQNPERGRQRLNNSSASTSGHKGTRSLSPFRVCDIFFESESNQQSSNSSTSSKSETKQTASASSSSSSSLSLFSTSSWKGYKKWNLKDLLLFRSASEGRATSKDPLKKYSLLKKSGGEDDVKNSSFRSTESGGGSVSLRRRGTASAHELHYTANRAVSEGMRWKTFLPYKHGLLGCLGFNPAVHDISRGLGSLTRG